MAKEKPPSEGLKGALAEALDHDRRRRKRRPKPAVQPKRDKQGKGIEAQGSERAMVNQIVSREAQSHGDYRISDFKLQEVTEGGKRKDKTIRVVRNFARTPVERWHQQAKLDDRQMQAILYYQNRWHMAFSDPRVTANYSPAVANNAILSSAVVAGSVVDAIKDLQMLDREVFKRRPQEFEVWQNVVLWDEPAGVAGARLGWKNREAEGVALYIVKSVANEIAMIVVDRRPSRG